MDLQKEIWRDVKGYEGKYQVSNFGRVKSVAKRLGHGDTETTQRVYIHLLDELAQEDDNKIMTVMAGI